MSCASESEIMVMPILYLMNAMPFSEESVLQATLPLVDIKRRECVMQMKDNKNRALSLAAGVLLSYAVTCYKKEEKPCLREVAAQELMAYLKEKEKQGAVSIPQIETYANGKPYLKNMPDVCFNLSHSGDYVVCVISDSEIGVDIQYHRRNIKEGVLKKVLHEIEKGEYGDFGEEEKESLFFQIWAAKEAYSKYTGEGLAIDFRLLLTDFKEGNILDTRTGIKHNLHMVGTLPDYAIAVVCKDKIDLER